MLTNIIRRNMHSRVAIIGAGPAGNSVSSQLINTGKFKASDITVFDPQQMHHYQPGYTNIAGGVWKTTHRDIMRDRESLLNPGLNWVREAVAYLEPSNNLVKTAEGNTHTYDYLVVASGLQLRYDLIKGAREALEDPECPVGSMYTLEFAQKMSQLRERYTGGKAIFTVPVMPIKCGGAPQKVMYLSEETWRKKNIDSDIHFYTSTPVMFPPCKKFSDPLLALAEQKGINIHFNHTIESVDGPNRTVSFSNGVTSHFDLLHIVPPQKAHAFVGPLAHSDTGFVDVNKDTLQHNTYENVFALGDIANLPTSKTAAAIFSQAPVVVQNLVNQDRKVSYNGYSSCPVFVGDRKLMLMEFKYGGIPDETFSSSQNTPWRLFYYFKKYLFPFVYWNFVPKGIWFGRSGFFKPRYN